MRKSKTEIMRDKWAEDSRWRKARGMPKLSYEEFVMYLHGKSPKYKPKFEPLKLNYRISNEEHRKKHPSREVFTIGNTSKKDNPVYTGTKLIGIATMHKSNMVPVFKKEEAEDIARMRR